MRKVNVEGNLDPEGKWKPYELLRDVDNQGNPINIRYIPHEMCVCPKCGKSVIRPYGSYDKKGDMILYDLNLVDIYGDEEHRNKLALYDRRIHTCSAKKK
jgi:hypothetical protein